MVTVAKALTTGRREALEALATQLADEIATTGNPRDRLAVIRAFLATTAQLEALDAAALRADRDAARKSPSVDYSGPNAVASLIQRRKRAGHAA